jgi:hypothetical protein
VTGYLGYEKRRCVRRPVAASRATLEWLTRDGLRSVGARLLDVSDEGMLLEAEEAPGAGQPVWLRFHEPMPSRTIGATAVRADVAHRVGLRLHGPCPPEVDRLVTTGFGLGSRPASQ